MEFENWRSLLAPPGISREDRARLEGAIEAMVRVGALARGARSLSLDRSLSGRGAVRALRRN